MPRLVNYIRVRRKAASLTQRELAFIVGYRNEGVVSKHESFRSVPPFLMALGYAVLFQIPVSDLFPGLHLVVEDAVKTALLELEHELRKKQLSGGGRKAALLTRKLEWLQKQRFAIEQHSTYEPRARSD